MQLVQLLFVNGRLSMPPWYVSHVTVVYVALHYVCDTSSMPLVLTSEHVVHHMIGIVIIAMPIMVAW